MASITLANIAAATAAGYAEIVTDKGASFSPASKRFVVVLEKRVVGGSGLRFPQPIRAYGEADTQGNAETQALAALNSQRNYRYGQDTTTRNKDTQGNVLTEDTH